MTTHLLAWHLYTVTAYSHGCTLPKSGVEHAEPQRAANGDWPEANWTVAASKDIPFGTVLELSYRGVVTTRIVGDRGRAIRRGRLDLFVESCDHAKRWGVRQVYVRVKTIPLGAIKGEPARSGTSK